jgi:3-oxoadipate enol-lactonase
LPPLWAEVTGSGPLVVLMHGLADTHGLWRYVAPVLAERYRVAAIDHYAHGQSPMPAGELTTEKMADAVAALIEREGSGRPAVVIGLSMGGGVAQVLALARPELVLGLGLVSTSSEFKPDNRDRFLRRADKAEREGMAAVIEETVPRWFTPEWLATSEGQAEYERTVATVMANPPERFAAASRANAERGWSNRLGEIRCPVLFVGGEHDPMGIHRVADIYREHLPNARIEIVPGVSHLIPIQKPEALNAILLDWLADVAA